MFEKIFEQTSLMESISTLANEVFDRSVADYHKTDNVDAAMENPYEKGTFESILYSKNWVDACSGISRISSAIRR